MEKHINLTRLWGDYEITAKGKYGMVSLIFAKDTMNVSLWKESCTYIIPNKRNFINFYTMMLFSKHSCPIFRKISFSTTYTNKSYVHISQSIDVKDCWNEYENIEHKEHV